jgi:NTE family protein
MIHRRTLGIALGAGSARGWAHIGVLRALREHGIEPDFVAGSSMGAMVGAAFAAGRIEQLEAWALSLDWKRVVGLADVGLRGGIFKGDRLLNLYQGQFVQCPFSKLSVPFATVATDLATGGEVWLRDGDVSDAVRASCTVPGLFKPVLREGRYLVDGSIVNPIPVSLCRAMGAQVVVAVDLGSDRARRFPLESKQVARPKSHLRGFFDILGPSPGPDVRPLPSIMDTLLGAIDIMQERIAQARLAAELPEIVLSPRLGTLGPFEYHRAAAAITAGHEIVTEMLPVIREALDA